ncbi:HDIG domain-containing protein [bacterium]|nr:HDIG domain-containing protein [bacterium]
MNDPTKTAEKNGQPTKEKKEAEKRVNDRMRSFDPSFYLYATLALATLCIYLLIRPPAAENISQFRLQEPSPKVVFAPFDYTYVDQIATKARQIEAQALVAPVYRYYPERFKETLGQITSLAQAASSLEKPETLPTDEWAQKVLEQAGFPLDNHVYVEENPREPIPKDTYTSLAFYRTTQSFWTTLIDHCQAAKGFGIADTVEPLKRNRQKNSSKTKLDVGVTLVKEDGTQLISTAVQSIYTQEEFFQRFEEFVSTSYPANEKDIPIRSFALDILRTAFIGPTLIYNREETEELQEKAREEVLPIIKSVERGETIVGKSEPVTQQHLQKLRALKERVKLSPSAELGYFVLGLIFVIMMMKFLQSYYAELIQDPRRIAVIFLSVILILGLSRIAEYLTMLDLGRNTLQQAGYAIPMGTMGVILTILASARLAAFCCALTTLYMGFILQGSADSAVLPYLVVAFMTASGSIYTVTRIQSRSDLYRAGGVTVLLASLTISAISLHDYKTLDQMLLHAEEMKFALIWGGVNGILVSILSIALMPIFEDFYGVTTDMRLLELSQKTELLQRLEEEAPGSYQHSMRVATLAETAAGSIGANSLLAKVGCYYHDIGKIEKPQYFVENQQSSADKAKHSKISPNMSCLIIRNHVKNGIELGKRYQIPKPILDFIPEHHGTTLMSYFYNQALASEESESKIKEADFRYPGPKPQSKETAIAMLADCLEAASRTLESCTEREIRQLVRKMINARFMDGQFDECNLTLKDLHTLFLTFSESLIHMLHQRIVYPERPVKEKPGEEKKTEESPTGTGEKKKKDSQTEKNKAIEENENENENISNKPIV